MNKHVRNARYLIVHKFHVFVAGRKLRVPIFRLLIHDWTKIFPFEWIAYANYFYGGPCSETRKRARDRDFQRAWLHHIHWNKHHFQHWIMFNDPSGLSSDMKPQCLRMPIVYVREMVADWIGAGMAIHGRMDVKGWYASRKEQILLHPDTRMLVETLIDNA
jgi:hypothetical protein